MVIKNKFSKKLLAMLLAAVLVMGTIPIGISSVFAATKDTFKVEIENYSFSAEVKLTDSTNSKDSDSVTAANGVATFTDFVDDEKTYNLEITDLVGYENYTVNGIIIESNSITVKETDLTAIEKATASGIVVDENDVAVSGVEVTYSAYSDAVKGTVTTDSTGAYSFEFYKSVDYSVSIKGTEKYVVKNDTFNSTADKDFGTHKLEIKQFGITVSSGANGTSNVSNVMVDYGEDAPSIVITANQNYVIKSLTIKKESEVNATEISDAVGKDDYDVSDLLTNIKENWTVNAEFVLNEIEVTFSITKTGKVEIEDGISISTAGKVTVSNGSDKTTLTESKKLLAGQTIQAVVLDNKYHIESFKVGDDELITSFDNDIHSSPVYTFDKTKTTITVVFALDIFNVTASAGKNGTITPTSKTVEYGESAEFIISPKEKYTLDSLKVNGVTLDVSSLTEQVYRENEDHSITYVLNEVKADSTVEVGFKEIVVDTGDWKEKSTMTASKGSIVTEYMQGIDTVYVFSNDAKVCFTPNSPFDRVDLHIVGKKKLNGENKYEGWASSITLKETSYIDSLQVKNKGKKNDTDLSFGEKGSKLIVIIDKTNPVLGSVPSMEWSKDETYTVNGSVSDNLKDGVVDPSNPSSGIDKVVYGTTLGYDNATSEAKLNADKTGYSFTVSNEENKTYYIYAVDKAGNVSDVKTFTSKIDTTAPTIDSFEIKNVNNDVKTTSFGTYSSTDVTVKIKASDAKSSVTNTDGANTCSGIKSITYYTVDKNGVKSHENTVLVNEENEISFVIPAIFKGQIYAKATDNAGNETTGVVAANDNTTINGTTEKLISNELTISTAKPTVSIVKDNTGATTDLIRHDETSGKVWFNGNANFIVTVGDELGINTIKVKLNGQDVETSSDGLTLKDIDFSYSGKTTTKTFKINTEMFSSTNVNGENVLEVITNNVCNNYNKDDKSAEKNYLYIDTTPPTVDNFEFKAKNTNFLSKTLNFLTFGIFFNEEIDVTVAASDDNASSGLKAITLYAGDNEVETIDVDNVDTDANTSDKCTFTLKMDDYNANQIISAVATDKVGNKSAKTMPNTTNSNILEANSEVSNGVGNAGLMIETQKPDITISCAEPALDKNSATADSNDWYADNTDFNVKVVDLDAGIRNVVIKINDECITTVKATDSSSNIVEHDEYHNNYDMNADVVGYDYRANKQTELNYVVNTALATRDDRDGSYKIEVVVTDNAGNVSETVTKTIYKDVDAPSVTNFKFEATGYDKDNAVTSTDTAPVTETSYGYYFVEDTKVTITADDVIPTSGIKSITYYTVDKDGGKSAEKTYNVNAENKISFDIPANFKGQIYAKATDNVDNTTTDFVNPNGTVIEDKEQHDKTSHIIYTLNDDAVKDDNGNNLYGDDTTVGVEIADTYSGIRQVDWEIVAPFDDKKQAGTVTVDNDGNVTSVTKEGCSDDCLAQWNVTTEDNLVTVLKNTIVITNNSNDIEIHFTLTDRAGNVTKDVVQKLSVDKSAPKIAIQMNENDDDTYNGFFRGERKVTVYVYERNFESSDFTFNVKRTDDYGNVSNVSPKAKFEKIGNQVIDGVECYVYKMSTTFTEDGDYDFIVSAKDVTSHISNDTAKKHEIKDSFVKYSSDKTNDYTAQNDADRNIDNAFTIDNTPSIVTVSYDNNDVRNDKYFNNHRTATITVTEHNFVTDNNRITYTRTSTKDGSNIEEPKVSNWSRSGNTYTATINYNADGDYTFAIDVVDKAGNETKDEKVSYNGKAAKDFVVDTTIDKPIITGVENGNSYKESVLPKIDFSDINFKDVDIKLIRIKKDEKPDDVANDYIKLNKNDKGGSFSANEDTFKKVQENDGIYTLSVEITDKAENTSSEQVTFTVNRFGSVYSLGKYLLNELNNKYVQSIDNDIVITEYNPDRLVNGKLDVVVTRDGAPVDYKAGELKISPVVNELAKIGSSGWYQYEYTISKSVFTDKNGDPIDGIYKVYVGSEDTAGNKSENISYDESEVMFRLDHTAPTIKSVSGLEKKIVNNNEHKVSYEIFDSIGIAEIDVYYYGQDGKKVDHIRDTDGEGVTDVLSDLTSYSGEFTIGSTTGAESVRIYVKDLAGNITDTDDDKFDIDSIEFNRMITVSTNFFVRWYADKVVFWSSIAVIAVAGAGLVFFIATKKRKKDDAKTEEIKRNARGSQD